MLQLTLIRHAKSSWDNSALSDFERPLNKRGIKNAPLMGKIIKKRGLVFDQIIASPALRAITTARLIAENWVSLKMIFSSARNCMTRRWTNCSTAYIHWTIQRKASLWSLTIPG